MSDLIAIAFQDEQTAFALRAELATMQKTSLAKDKEDELWAVIEGMA